VGFLLESLSDEAILKWLGERHRRENEGYSNPSLLQRAFNLFEMDDIQSRILEKHFNEYGCAASTLRFLSKKEIKQVISSIQYIQVVCMCNFLTHYCNTKGSIRSLYGR
jgi:redox-regulated HSP33 family molecular chaperone